MSVEHCLSVYQIALSCILSVPTMPFGAMNMVINSSRMIVVF
jgi:hypothetical protein